MYRRNAEPALRPALNAVAVRWLSEKKQEAGAFTAEEEEMNDDNNDIAAPQNEGANNMDSTADFFDWEKIVHEAENAEDDSSSDYIMEEDEELPTDDELEYVSDSDSAMKDILYSEDIDMLPREYVPDIPASIELSEDSKALLFWRDDKDGMSSFSDWKIKVEVEKTEDDDCSEEMVTAYNVHRFALAMGPKKSGYFEALLQSDCYSENSDCVSTVKLPEKIAKDIPDFLDYLYAQPLESSVVINFENWKSMRYFANYFLVPRLTEAVAEFIEKDMEYFNLDHMENYIFEFHLDISDDMSRRILPKAVHICAKMFQFIEVDSPLLMSIPPAMLWSIMRRICVDDKQKTIHTFSLLAAYIECNVEDRLIFSHYFCELPLEPWFCNNLGKECDDSMIELSLTWFRLLIKRGWHIETEECRSGSVCFKRGLEDIIRNYLHSKPPSMEIMERIVRDVPNDVVAKIFKESVDEARRLKQRG